MEVPLALILAHHPGLLQQEVGDPPAVGLAATAELDLKVLPLRMRERRGPESLRDASPMTLSPEDERTQSADMRPERHLSYDSV